eukprot:m51a1_g6279 hypothetical protein (552) ;mRNA; f:196724-203414
MVRRSWLALACAVLVAAATLVSLALSVQPALPPPDPPDPPYNATLDWWKDRWLLRWIARHPNPAADTGSCSGARCTGTQYVPRRAAPRRAQEIPRVIWNTWQSTSMGPVQHRLLRRSVDNNPDYEYVLFTDEDCWEFVCKYADARTQRAYELVRPGAAKADIWRLLVVYRYGGVYIDSDCIMERALDTEMWANASVVISVGVDGYTPQWLLAYTPRHPIIRRALERTVDNVLATYEAKKFQAVSDLSGPQIYHFQAVLPLITANGFEKDRGPLSLSGERASRDRRVQTAREDNKPIARNARGVDSDRRRPHGLGQPHMEAAQAHTHWQSATELVKKAVDHAERRRITEARYLFGLAALCVDKSISVAEGELAEQLVERRRRLQVQMDTLRDDPEQFALAVARRSARAATGVTAPRAAATVPKAPSPQDPQGRMHSPSPLGSPLGSPPPVLREERPAAAAAAEPPLAPMPRGVAPRPDRIEWTRSQGSFSRIAEDMPTSKPPIPPSPGGPLPLPPCAQARSLASQPLPVPSTQGPGLGFGSAPAAVRNTLQL